MKKTGLLLSSLFALTAHAAPNATTSTAGGVVAGVQEASGVIAYKGIPYAAAPVGKLRWKAPQPVAKWQGTRKADKFGARCMQLPLFGDMVFRSDGVSEDCLFLNVWTPAKSAKEKLPVLVYFYGGGFAAGDGSEPRYDGESMAAKGIVTLTVNYRLNVFGFLAHPELTREAPHHSSGNYGLMDQAAALQWVRKNIAAFGGDPARVTIAGESAGSFSVSAQMINPQAQGLIAGAIGESGALLGLTPPARLADAEQKGAEFAKAIAAPTLSQLRELPAQKLLESAQASGIWFSAIQDGYVIPRAPAEVYAAGEQAKIPLLAGWNSQEGHYKQIFQKDEPSEALFVARLQGLYGDQAATARQAYSGDYKQAATNLASDLFIGHGTWKWIDAHARTSGKPVYRYYYTQPRPGQEGAGHSVEIEYAMGNLAGNKVYAWSADDYALSTQLQDYFANFIKRGNPNGAGLPEWPQAHAGAGSKLMRLGVPSVAATADDDTRQQFLDTQAKR
ncbi:carboxylesterase family protein [Duganella sp. sic0402]|uniref:carboxylesterase/lipase family protein n=1 Tax=Duganella sp. sic0402 TaxID=2854786 RepID=UPI001C454133|nr:carboxylesterase family protein [Duganella sp. sic0402]MBV7537618.1 carboxylesterase family protein [Duganella sp. sic0402]